MILFVGESNPYGMDPSMALHPLPAHAAGGRLCSILGIGPRTYLRRYRRANLLSTNGKWDKAAALASACDLYLAMKGQDARFVLLGSKVSEAFAVPFEPFRVHKIDSLPLLVLPHPSGRCRIWNDPESTLRARAAFQAFTLRPKLECGREGCHKPRETSKGFCKQCGDEFFARLFPSHPKQGEPFPLKAEYRSYRLRGEPTP